MSADPPQRPGKRISSISFGNVRRFVENLVMPPLGDAAQRTAGHAAAAAALEENLGFDSVQGAFATAGSTKVTQPNPDIPQDAEAAAFFDIDNTLIQGSSLVLLGRGLVKKKILTWQEILPGIIKHLRYRLSGSERESDILSGRELALSLVRGKEVGDLLELTDDIVDRQIISRAFDDTLELAQMHLQAGQQVWLVSATPVQIGQALAKRLGFTGALGTVAEEDNGVFTGRLVGDILHGQGKRHAVAALASIQDLDFEKCTAYSDSINDIPMLSMVGTPVAVNPDWALRRHAKAAGWDIRDYRPVRRMMMPAAAAAGLGLGAWALAARRQKKTRTI